MEGSQTSCCSRQQQLLQTRKLWDRQRMQHKARQSQALARSCSLAGSHGGVADCGEGSIEQQLAQARQVQISQRVQHRARQLEPLSHWQEAAVWRAAMVEWQTVKKVALM